MPTWPARPDIQELLQEVPVVVFPSTFIEIEEEMLLLDLELALYAACNQEDTDVSDV